MFLSFLRLEGDKTFRRLLPWLGLIVALMPAILTISIFFGAGAEFMARDLLTWPGGIGKFLEFAAGFSAGTGYGLYLLVIVAGVLLGQEYSWRTMYLWLSHGVSRTHLLSAKFVQMVILALAIVLAFMLVGILFSIIFMLLAGDSFDASKLDSGQLFLSWLRTTLGMFPYLGLSFLIGVISRSTVAAIGGVFLFMVGIELPLSFILPNLSEGYARAYQFFPAALANNLSLENVALARQAVTHTAVQLPIWVTLLVIVGYTLILFALAIHFFRRQDLVG